MFRELASQCRSSQYRSAVVARECSLGPKRLCVVHAWSKHCLEEAVSAFFTLRWRWTHHTCTQQVDADFPMFSVNPFGFNHTNSHMDASASVLKPHHCCCIHRAASECTIGFCCISTAVASRENVFCHPTYHPENHGPINPKIQIYGRA